MSNNIHVTFRHVDPSQPLKDYVTEKKEEPKKDEAKPAADTDKK